jgi:transcriptional regulator with XRE-family HTH domain
MNKKPKVAVYSDINNTLRKMLIKQRNELDYSQRYLAKKLNVSQSVISNIETGSRSLDVLEFTEYSNALGITIDNFMSVIQNAQEASSDVINR